MASGLSADVLARQAAEDDYRRGKAFKNNFERIAIVAMWLISLAILAVGMTWLYHLLTPDSWHWLSPDALSKVQNIVTGGILAGVLAEHFKKRVS